MALTLTLTMTAECSGKGHFTIVVSGDKNRTFYYTGDQMTRDLTNEDFQTFVELYLRAYQETRTNPQVRTALLAGISVVI